MRVTKAQLALWKKKRPDLFGKTEERGQEKQARPRSLRLREQDGRNIYIKNGKMRVENGWIVPWNYQRKGKR